MSKFTGDDDKRWVALASVVTFALFGTLCALLIGASAGFITLSAIGQPWFLLYSAALSTATVWLYGEELRSIRNGD